jgi:hypothetical protein
VSSKYLLFAPSVGCDPSKVFFKKKRNILAGSNGDYKGYISLESEGMNKDGVFSFQARSVRTDKF